MNKYQIEKQSRELIGAMWSARTTVWPDKDITKLDLLDPSLAAEFLGVYFDNLESLGSFGNKGNRFEVAGSLDRDMNQILISNKFNRDIQRFTGAHEIGHWVLHKGNVKHRDLPIKGLNTDDNNRPKEEQEADHFAACFLMPRNLVKEHFEYTFQTNVPIEFDDDIAFWLAPDDPDSLLRYDKNSLNRELALASAESYQGRTFHSLAKQFRVSTKSMAIRIKELKLIKY